MSQRLYEITPMVKLWTFLQGLNGKIRSKDIRKIVQTLIEVVQLPDIFMTQNNTVHRIHACKMNT